MSAQHTPGPWHIGRPFPQIYGPLGEHIANCEIGTNFHRDNWANARLIAAAPELLEALHAARNALEHAACGQFGIDFKSSLDVVRDAIAKTERTK